MELTNTASVLHKTLKKYYNDFYQGKIKILCDDDCLEDCDGDHGNYDLDALNNKLKENKGFWVK